MNEGTCHCLDWQNCSQTTRFPLACSSSAHNSVIQPPIPVSFFHPPLPALSDLPPATKALRSTCAASGFTQLSIQVKGWGERRNDGAISCMPHLATDPQSPDSFCPSFSVGADQVLGGFSWAGSQEVPPLLGVAELVPSNAESVMRTHTQVNAGSVCCRLTAQLWNLGFSPHLPQGCTVGFGPLPPELHLWRETRTPRGHVTLNVNNFKFCFLSQG